MSDDRNASPAAEAPPGERRRVPDLALAAARWTARAVLGLVYPPCCIGCRSATSEPHGLCAECWTRITFIERPLCERLGTPFELDIGGPLLSPAAIAEPPAFARGRAVCRHDEVARELVQRLKYGDRLDLAEAMAGMMVAAGRELLADADIIVPMPLHRWRLWRRRFNQSALLAGIIARRSGVRLDAFALERVRRTRPQVGLTRAERVLNLQGAFRVPVAARPRLAARRVLLVDDVLTTGASANAAARALLRGGAGSVDLLTFGRVVVGR